MKGKVFDSSLDVYQDQAKVLFDFYLRAAEKIVSQEEEIEKQQAALAGKHSTAEDDKRKTIRNLIIWAVVAVAGIVLVFAVGLIAGLLVIAAGVAMAVVTLVKFNRSNGEISNIDDAQAELERKKREIFRDYKVSKIGIAYVPVARQVPFDGKSIVIDYSGQTPHTSVKMQMANNPKALGETMDELEQLSTKAPIIEKNEQVEEVETDDYSRSIQQVKFYDYFGKLDRTLRAGTYFLSDISTQTVSMPLIEPGTEMIDYLKEYGTTERELPAVVNVFNMEAYDKEIAQFEAINQARKDFSRQNTQFEDVLKHLIHNVGIAVQTIATLKVASNNKMVESSNKLLFTILKNSYNHYSPLLEHDEIEKMRNTTFNYSDSVEGYKPFELKASSRVRYDVVTGNWVAEDGSTTTAPFGISQIQEEIVAPIVQNLLAETRIERMHIYNDIKNQKIDFLNQWHRDTEDFYGRNRSSSDDLLNIMRSNMTKFLASQTTLESLESMKRTMRHQLATGEAATLDATGEKDKMGQTLAAFEVQSQQFRKAQDDFDDYMERLKEDIDDKAESFEYIEYYDASLRDRMAKDIVTAGDNVGELDARRRPLASISPLYAQESVLPPSPSVEDSVKEQLSLNVAKLAANSLEEINE